MLPLQEELWCVFLSNKKPFGRAVGYIEAIKTSAITITRARKFIAMLRPLRFNTKIHTFALNISFVRKDMCRAGSKETFLKMGTLSVEARAYPHEIKTNIMNFTNAAISPL